jgi:hypothetical protein
VRPVPGTILLVIPGARAQHENSRDNHQKGARTWQQRGLTLVWLWQPPACVAGCCTRRPVTMRARTPAPPRTGSKLHHPQ